jgi:hypothetical protein
VLLGTRPFFLVEGTFSHFDTEALQGALSRLTTLLNGQPERFCVEPSQQGNMYSGGRDVDYVTRRLQQFKTLAPENDAETYPLHCCFKQAVAGLASVHGEALSVKTD